MWVGLVQPVEGLTRTRRLAVPSKRKSLLPAAFEHKDFLGVALAGLKLEPYHWIPFISGLCTQTTTAHYTRVYSLLSRPTDPRTCQPLFLILNP